MSLVPLTGIVSTLTPACVAMELSLVTGMIGRVSGQGARTAVEIASSSATV